MSRPFLESFKSQIHSGDVTIFGYIHFPDLNLHMADFGSLAWRVLAQRVVKDKYWQTNATLGTDTLCAFSLYYRFTGNLFISDTSINIEGESLFYSVISRISYIHLVIFKT